MSPPPYSAISSSINAPANPSPPRASSFGVSCGFTSGFASTCARQYRSAPPSKYSSHACKNSPLAAPSTTPSAAPRPRSIPPSSSSRAPSAPPFASWCGSWELLPLALPGRRSGLLELALRDRPSREEGGSRGAARGSAQASLTVAVAAHLSCHSRRRRRRREERDFLPGGAQVELGPRSARSRVGLRAGSLSRPGRSSRNSTARTRNFRHDVSPA